MRIIKRGENRNEKVNVQVFERSKRDGEGK